jgi:diguanylate cyclase (GGDEF)-like protein
MSNIESIVDQKGNFKPIEVGLSHIAHVLNETWPCKAWVVLRFTNKGWFVWHVEDEHYGFQEGDLFVPDEHGYFPFSEGAIADHGRSFSVACMRGDRKVIFEPVRGHVFHVIVTEDGEPFAGVLAISPNKLVESVCRSSAMISLLGEMVMQTHSVCTGYLEVSKQRQAAVAEASVDPLTGLINLRGWRNHASRELSRLKRKYRSTSVIIIDIDNFKFINDTKGHAEGDRLLHSIARILSDNVREGDIVARLGGDEFAILAMDTEKNGAEAMCETLKKEVLKSGVSCSFGFQHCCEGKSLELCIDEADKLMYENKRKNRCNVV